MPAAKRPLEAMHWMSAALLIGEADSKLWDTKDNSHMIGWGDDYRVITLM